MLTMILTNFTLHSQNQIIIEYYFNFLFVPIGLVDDIQLFSSLPLLVPMSHCLLYTVLTKGTNGDQGQNQIANPTPTTHVLLWDGLYNHPCVFVIGLSFSFGSPFLEKSTKPLLRPAWRQVLIRCTVKRAGQVCTEYTLLFSLVSSSDRNLHFSFLFLTITSSA